MPRGRKPGWAERGEKGGRPKGSYKEESEKGRKTLFKSFTVSCHPEEYIKIKELSEQSGKTVSRFLVESVIG